MAFHSASKGSGQGVHVLLLGLLVPGIVAVVLVLGCEHSGSDGAQPPADSAGETNGVAGSWGPACPPPYVCDFEDEAAVYNACVKWFFPTATNELVIKGTTECAFTDQADLERLPSDVGEDTIAYYCEKNTRPYALGMNPFVRFPMPYTFLDPSLFPSPDFWSVFYSTYPGALGLASFSRVGFDKDRRQALVYFSMAWGPIAAEWFFLILQKVEGNWIVTSDVCLGVA
jgi:hypothetical protein